MIKKYMINKIVIASLCLVLLLLFYFFPTKQRFETNIIVKEDLKENVVYMLDNDNYVSKVITYFNSNSLENEIRNKIEILTLGKEDLNDFHPIIPSNTKLKSIKIDKNNVYLDFSKELLDVSIYHEEEMIESIVYTLSEINGIDNIYISVEGKELKELPVSHKELDYPLTRNYGINKQYDLNNFDNIDKTIIYFLKQNDDKEYIVPITKVSNTQDDKINIIIQELKSSVNAQNNLKSYINENTELITYKLLDNEIELTFNDYLFKTKQSEDLLVSSIFENYNVDKIVLKNEDNSTNIIRNK